MDLNDLDIKSAEFFDIGDRVVCDICNRDYTNDLVTQGGILFGSKAVCPNCAPGLEESAKIYDEEDYITDRCPAGMTFREWVLGLRDGDNLVCVYSLE